MTKCDSPADYRMAPVQKLVAYSTLTSPSVPTEERSLARGVSCLVLCIWNAEQKVKRAEHRGQVGENGYFDECDNKFGYICDF